jgi:hypothetical protein
MPEESAKLTEANFREREVAAKEADIALRREEQRLRIEQDRRSRWTGPLMAGIAAATVAATANVWVNYYNASQSRAAERCRNLSAAVTDFARILTRAYQQQEWILWKAVHEKPVSESDVKAFDTRMADLLPNLLASHVHLANQNRKMYEAMNPMVERIIKLDAKVAEALLARESRSAAQFDSLLREANAERSKIGVSIAKAITNRDTSGGCGSR